MSYIPVRLLPVSVTEAQPSESWTVDDGTGDPWLNQPYRWAVTFSVSQQTHSSHLTRQPFSYTGKDIVVGDWFADVATSSAVRIIEISNADDGTVVCVVEDVDRFNTFTDPTQAGTSFSSGAGFVFSLGDDGLPVLGSMTPQQFGLQPNLAFQQDLVSRFRYRNYLRTHAAIHQPGHGFVVGDLIRMKSDGTYVKALPTQAVGSLVGSVSDIGIPGADWFSYRPVGRIDENVQPALPGAPGSLVYIAVDGTLTVTRPTAWAKPVYLRLESANKAIVLDRSVDGTNSNGYSSQIYVVASLTARNSLAGLNPGDQAFVQDVGNGEWTHYLYEMGGSWRQLVTQDSSATDAYTKQIPITFQSDPSATFAVISDGRRVEEVVVEVTQAFNGNATLTVGTSDDHALLMSADQNDLSSVNNYQIDPSHVFNTGGADTTIKYYLTTSNCTTGAALISVTYS